MNVRGEVLLPLDEAAVARVAGELDRHGVESVAIGLLHAYVNPHHERRIRDIVARDLEAAGIACPLFLMTSGGGMTTLATALRFPIRLVESGPSGGAGLPRRGGCGRNRGRGRNEATSEYRVDRVNLIG